MPTDPQSQASIFQQIVAALFGGAGTGVFSWWRSRSRTSQDIRCERICSNMVAAMEAMLAALEAIGGATPGLNSAIVNVRVQIEHAKQWLDGDGQ